MGSCSELSLPPRRSLYRPESPSLPALLAIRHQCQHWHQTRCITNDLPSLIGLDRLWLRVYGGGADRIRTCDTRLRKPWRAVYARPASCRIGCLSSFACLAWLLSSC